MLGKKPRGCALGGEKGGIAAICRTTTISGERQPRCKPGAEQLEIRHRPGRRLCSLRLDEELRRRFERYKPVLQRSGDRGEVG